MSTLADHERNRLAHQGKPPWLRILAYARRYVPLVGVALGLTLLTAGAEYGRAYLLKLVIDDVALPQGAIKPDVDVRSWLPALPWSDAPAKAPRAVPEPRAELDAAQRAHLEQQIRGNLLRILMLAALIAVMLPALNFFREYLQAYTLARINVDMTLDACAKLLALPLSFHHGRRRGDVYARVVSDLKVAHSALALLFADVVQAILTILVGVVFLVYVSWQLSLALIVVGPVLFGVIGLFSTRIRASARKRQAQVSEVTQRLLEILEGIKVIKAFRAEAAEHSAYTRQTDKLFHRSMRVVKNRILSRTFVDFLNQVTTLGGLCVGGLLLLRGMWGITLGDLAAFFVITSQIYRPLKRLAKAWVNVIDSMASAERFLEVMDNPVEIRDAPDAIQAGPVREGVAVRNLWFGYGTEPVLRNLSFETEAGEVIAIVGRTGAGKTTLVDLLMRLHDPTEGSISIDGLDLRRFTRDSLLSQIAVVTQEPFLFDGSIRENLRYGRPDATEDEVLAAARAAHVDEFVNELPRGYDTEVGPSGMRLSGGQRQRITIGRAILKDPSILILDEATSSLDSRSEKYVQEAIDALLGEQRRTVFVIAHRLSTIRRADRILVLEKGVITQQGTHDELLRRGGLYRELLELQTTPM